MKVLVAACAMLTVLLGLAGWQLRKAYRDIGRQAAQIEAIQQVAEANKATYARAAAAKDAQIASLARARALSDAAVAASIEQERASQQRIAALERSLREAVANDEQSSDWGGMRVPDAVIDGMRGAAPAAGARGDR